METGGFKDLMVWQKAMRLTKLTYEVVKKLPPEELYVLSSQMRRAAISIPSNISEGFDRNSPKEYHNFLSIARGSNAELQTQLYLCVELGFMGERDIKDALDLSFEVGRMLTGLMSSVERRFA